MQKLTQKSVFAELSRIGVAIKRTGWDNEFRVCVRGETEATAYYTDDLEDARDTGLAMARNAAERASAVEIDRLDRAEKQFASILRIV